MRYRSARSSARAERRSSRVTKSPTASVAASSIARAWRRPAVPARRPPSTSPPYGACLSCSSPALHAFDATRASEPDARTSHGRPATSSASAESGSQSRRPEVRATSRGASIHAGRPAGEDRPPFPGRAVGGGAWPRRPRGGRQAGPRAGHPPGAGGLGGPTHQPAAPSRRARRSPAGGVQERRGLLPGRTGPPRGAATPALPSGRGPCAIPGPAPTPGSATAAGSSARGVSLPLVVRPEGRPHFTPTSKGTRTCRPSCPPSCRGGSCASSARRPGSRRGG